MELVAEGEDTLLGAALFLVASGTAEGRVEMVLVKSVEQRLRLHQVGVYLRAVRKRSHARLESLLVAFNDELPSVFLGIPVAELQHLLEFPFRVDVHQGEGRFSRCESLFGQTHHDAAVFTDAIEHHGVFKFRSHFADDVDGLSLKFLEMAQAIVFRHK